MNPVLALAHPTPGCDQRRPATHHDALDALDALDVVRRSERPDARWAA